jgi:hypothetical protein
MRRLTAWWVGVAVTIGWALSPSPARAADGFWVTLAAGLGSAGATSNNEFWFDTPHGPPPIALTELSGGASAQASTGGGDVYFGGAGTPILLNTTDGAAYVSGGGPPAGAVTAATKGNKLASGGPTAGGALPSDAALLGIKLGEPDTGGARGLTAALTDPNGNPLGSGSVLVPDGGWWIVGLTPGATTTPGPVDPPVIDPPPVDPPSEPPSEPGPVGPPGPLPTGGPVSATPEPSAGVLVALGGLSAGLWRRLSRRKTG